MLHLSHVQGFRWDNGNGRKSADKHGVTQSEAKQTFFNEPFLVLADHQHTTPGHDTTHSAIQMTTATSM